MKEPNLIIRFFHSPQLTPFRIRDFRLLWSGAFLSFIGSWVQNVAQGILVMKLTNNPAMLTWVTFTNSMPVALFGPFAGTFADTLNKRAVLIANQLVYSANALFLATSIHFGFLRLEFIYIVALINGFNTMVEIPTRQSLVSRVVPPENMASAVPMQAMSFNLARIIGPAIGGVLLAKFGPQANYLVNGLSYLALIFAATAIRADLSSVKRHSQPIIDLISEGVRYTWRDRRLRMLFLMECTVSIFGLAYIPLLPAFAVQELKNPNLLGSIFTAVGIGAMTGLGTLIAISQRPIKRIIVKVSMTMMGIALILISLTHSLWVIYPMFALIGLSAIMQFNTTNTLFQTLSPERMKGRVISMHVWALNGSSPAALPLFGWLASNLSVGLAMRFGGAVVLAGALLAWVNGKRLQGVD
ncbi:MAG: MFS transporter [Chthonomonas sp.]|nr:MFS transporter [Chthonomonas sp.]